MESMLLSEFKARCIQVLKTVQQTGKPIIVTRRGRPLARIEPIPEGPGSRRLGVLKGRMDIKVDLVTVDMTEDWEMGR